MPRSSPLALANRRIAELETALRQARQEIAEANGQIRKMIEADLADDDARHNFVLTLGGQVADLQENLDAADADLNRAAAVVDEQDEHISSLRLALLRRKNSQTN